MQNLFINAENLFLKYAQNLSAKNAPNAFLNTLNFTSIKRRMFPELHEVISEIQKVFLNKMQETFPNLHKIFSDKQKMLCEISKTFTLVMIYTAQKKKFSMKGFFSKCDQICSFLRIWSHLLKKFSMENFIFCAVLKKAF